MLERLNRFAALQLERVPVESQPAPASTEAGRIVLHRKRLGTLPLDDLPHDEWEGQPSGAWPAIPTIALYRCDGHRTLAVFKFLRKHGDEDF